MFLLLLLSICFTFKLYSSPEIKREQIYDQVMKKSEMNLEKNCKDALPTKRNNSLTQFRQQQRANYMLFISSLLTSLCFPYTLSYAGF